MLDSPVGIAAWLVEKFNSWSDTVGNVVESTYYKEELLTNICVWQMVVTCSVRLVILPLTYSARSTRAAL